jgi:hypothetical protein
MRRTLPLLLLLAACTNPAKQATPTAGPSTPAPTTSSPVPSSPVPSPAQPCATATAPKDTGPESNPPGDIPDSTAFVTYTSPKHTYAVKVPEGWARTASGERVTFTDKYNAVNVTLVAAAKPPTVASAKSAEVPAIAARCFALRDVTTVTRAGAGTAVLVRYRADAAPDPVTGKAVRDDVERYEFWRNGTEAVLTLSGAQGADNVDPWKTVSDSFRWL